MTMPGDGSRATARPIPLNRRRRKPVSCMPCRQRKSRCDRAFPACGNCVDHGDIAACSYVSRRPGVQSARPSQGSKSPEQLQNKVDRLEQLIMNFMGKATSAEGQEHRSIASQAENGQGDMDIYADTVDTDSVATDESQGPVTESLDAPVGMPAKSVMKIAADYTQSRSLNEGHWALLLNEIGEVRGYLQAQQKQYEDQSQKIAAFMRCSPDDPGPTLLFGSGRSVGRSEILSQLPSKHACDTITTRYFASIDPALYILHEPTFYRQYEIFWQDRSRVSIVWIALLHAVLRIAVNNWTQEGDEPLEYQGKCQDMATTFRNRFSDCLILADYTQPHDHLIEALCLHLYAEYSASRDSKSSVWVLCGIVVRLAMRMGYHRETQPMLTATPFHAEMRRRTWAFIRQADVLFSFQIGLPSMIRLRNFEKTLPRNIYDDSPFHEGCKVLPPAVPDTEPTKISFIIAKTRLAYGFACALKEMDLVDSVPYERVLEIDRGLRKMYENVPEHYKLRSMGDQTQDPLPLIFSRFTLANIHAKSLCVVHSRFLELSRKEKKYEYSRRTCLESAMALLRYQAIQHQDICVDGRTGSLTKYQTSLTIHDYLLAATIISAELCLSAPAPAFPDLGQRPPLAGPSWMDMFTALDASTNIFSQMRHKSIEAYKASDVLGMLLKKLQDPTRANTPIIRHVEYSCRNKAPTHVHRPFGAPTGVGEPQLQFSVSAPRTTSGTRKAAIDPSPASTRDDYSTRAQELRLGSAHDYGTVGGASYLAVPGRHFDGLPALLDQQHRDHHVREPLGNPPSSNSSASNFPTFFDWPAAPPWSSLVPPPPSPPPQPRTLWQEGQSEFHPAPDLLQPSTMQATYAPLLDLNDPVSTLWGLNSGSDPMDTQAMNSANEWTSIPSFHG